MKHRLLALGLLLGLPLGLAWYVIRSARWERRKGFHGHYEQPLERDDAELLAEFARG